MMCPLSKEEVRLKNIFEPWLIFNADEFRLELRKDAPEDAVTAMTKWEKIRPHTIGDMFK